MRHLPGVWECSLLWILGLFLLATCCEWQRLICSVFAELMQLVGNFYDYECDRRTASRERRVGTLPERRDVTVGEKQGLSRGVEQKREWWTVTVLSLIMRKPWKEGFPLVLWGLPRALISAHGQYSSSLTFSSASPRDIYRSIAQG